MYVWILLVTKGVLVFLPAVFKSKCVSLFLSLIYFHRRKVISTEMASFKPTKIQVYPKLGEKVTQDTLYWKNYKVRLFSPMRFIIN